MAKKKGRVLTRSYIDGTRYECDDVIVIDEKVAKAYGDVLDMTPAAAEYAEKTLGREPIVHGKAY